LTEAELRVLFFESRTIYPGTGWLDTVFGQKTVFIRELAVTLKRQTLQKNMTTERKKTIFAK
jgi:hypothetical protein